MKETNKKNTTKGKKKNAAQEIDILALLMFYLKKLWLIILVGVIAGGLGFAATKLLIQPTYKCSFTAYVNNKKAATSTDAINNSDVSAAKQLVLTYSQIFKSNTILASADEEMNQSYDVKSLKKMVGIEIQNETEIIQVYAIAKSPEKAYEIASAVAKVSPKIMGDIVEGSSMKIVEYPQLPDSIYSPNYGRYTIISFLAGVLLTLVFLTIVYLRNDTITDEKEIEDRFSVPVLGVIPDTNSSTNKKSGYYYNYYYENKDEGEKKQ